MDYVADKVLFWRDRLAGCVEMRIGHAEFSMARLKCTLAKNNGDNIATWRTRIFNKALSEARTCHVRAMSRRWIAIHGKDGEQGFPRKFDGRLRNTLTN